MAHKKIILGITGGFGTGKSTAAKYFKAFGAEVIDADKIAHEAIRPDTIVYKRIVTAFGARILGKNRFIDRKKLSAVVFDKKAFLIKLNRIVHPEVVKAIKERIKHSHNCKIVLDVPLLFEAKLERLADKIIVVKASQANQIKRLSGKIKLSEEEIKKRIHAQLPISVKVRKADFVIDNNGPLEETKKQLEQLRRRLWKS